MAEVAWSHCRPQDIVVSNARRNEDFPRRQRQEPLLMYNKGYVCLLKKQERPLLSTAHNPKVAGSNPPQFREAEQATN